VLAALVRAGAREALPGEFTRRAVLNGKLDLVQAEAVGDLIDARSGAMRRSALAQLDGGLSRRVSALRHELIALEALLAYDVDFPEEDDGPVPRSRVSAACATVIAALEQLLATAPAGEVVREGATVVIAGAPNAGKSSLFNAVLGRARALVTSVPGTTRDAIEAVVDAGRWPLRLVDTAGLRETSDVVERLGIEVSERYLAGAHVVLACGASAAEVTEAVARVRALSAAPVLAVRTKADLDAPPGAGVPAEAPAGSPVALAVPEVWVSAERGTGLRELLDAVVAVLDAHHGAPELDAPLVTRARHVRALAEARDELVRFAALWRADALPATVAAIHVRSAVHALEALVGSVDVDDVLERVFSTFCVGK
jgi:tRNA modification GTPase